MTLYTKLFGALIISIIYYWWAGDTFYMCNIVFKNFWSFFIFKMISVSVIWHKAWLACLVPVVCHWFFVFLRRHRIFHGLQRLLGLLGQHLVLGLQRPPNGLQFCHTSSTFNLRLKRLNHFFFFNISIIIKCSSLFLSIENNETIHYQLLFHFLNFVAEDVLGVSKTSS